MFNIQTTEFNFGGKNVTLETGKLARQADGAVLLSVGNTKILSTAVIAKSAKENQDFFPLTVNYQEKFYSNGKIPGGFLKRESRPSESETLTSRLIDRPLRPLFPEGFFNEVHIITTVLSLDEDTNIEVMALIASSAALTLSGAPFNGPVGAANVGYLNDNCILNPTDEQLQTSKLNLTVAGTKNAVLMVESEAQELSEELMLEAVSFGHSQMQTAIDAIMDLKSKAAKPPIVWEEKKITANVCEFVSQNCEQDLISAYNNPDKQQRYAAIDASKTKLTELLLKIEEKQDSTCDANDYFEAFNNLKSKIVRTKILNKEPRIDGRDSKTVRPITCEVGILPRAHGSALFTRGETQALVATTLGTDIDGKLVETLKNTSKDKFMLHYNFPPFSVGECGRLGPPGRREIGHGMLARRGISAILPDSTYPYTVRVVSEITESNGSSSMATICGASLSLMDAGVPIKKPVAGIAMGLIKEDNNFQVITDILGDEDHLGDMDFKVAGTANGITALQMDIKIEGITTEIMQIALEQAKEGRMNILREMNQVLNEPRKEVAQHAPRFFEMKVGKDDIKVVIGKGGETIKSITNNSNAKVEIDETGLIKIIATSDEEAKVAIDMIKKIVAKPEIGVIYNAVVKKIVDFGAFVEYIPGKEGLVHISQIKKHKINKVSDYLTEGQNIQVKLTDIDRQGRVKLSMTAV